MKDHGLLTISDPDKDRPVEERPTFQCCHCGGHFTPPEKSKNVIRDFVIAGASTHDLMVAAGGGFCQKCDGPYCGARGCNPDKMQPHISWEHQQDILERKLNKPSDVIIVGGSSILGG